MTATNPVTRDFSCIDDPAVFIEDSFDAATIRQMEGLSPSAVVMLSPQRMSANADSSNDENDDPSCGGYHCHASNTKRRLSIGDASTPNQKRPLGHSRQSTSQKRHPIVTPLVATPEQIPAHKRDTVSNSGRRSNGVLQGSTSGGRVFGTNLLVNQHHVTHRTPTTIDANLFDITPTKEKEDDDDDESSDPSEEDALEATALMPDHSLIDHFCKESAPTAPATPEFKGISEEELLDHYVPLEEYEKVLKERNRYREMYRYQSSMCDDYYQREREAQDKLQDKIRELIAVSSRNEESKRFIRQMKREMLDCRERTLPFLNKKIEDDRKEKEIKDKFARQLMIEEENFERLEQQMKEEMAAMEAMLKDLRKACSLGKSSESLLKASYQKNTHLYGELCQSRRQLDSELDRRVHLEKLNEILRKEKREAELGTSRERRRHFSREDTLIREAHELQDEIVRIRQKLLDRAAAAGVNLMEESDEEEEEFEVVADEEEDEHRNEDASFVIDEQEEEEGEVPPRRSTRLSPPTARKALFPLEDITSEHTTKRV